MLGGKPSIIVRQTFYCYYLNLSIKQLVVIPENASISAITAKLKAQSSTLVCAFYTRPKRREPRRAEQAALPIPAITTTPPTISTSTPNCPFAFQLQEILSFLPPPALHLRFKTRKHLKPSPTHLHNGLCWQIPAQDSRRARTSQGRSYLDRIPLHMQRLVEPSSPLPRSRATCTSFLWLARILGPSACSCLPTSANEVGRC